jgi:hypothetical protein
VAPPLSPLSPLSHHFLQIAGEKDGKRSLPNSGDGHVSFGFNAAVKINLSRRVLNTERIPGNLAGKAPEMWERDLYL